VAERLWAKIGRMAGAAREKAQGRYNEVADPYDPELPPVLAWRIGLRCHRAGDLDGARAAYGRAIDSGSAKYGPPAARNLGVLLEAAGDLEAARAAYQIAVASGHPDSAPLAAFDLGTLSDRAGDRDSACCLSTRRRLQAQGAHTPGSGQPGGLARAAGDLEGVRTAYQLAIDSGHPDHAPHGAVALSRMLDSRFWWRQDAYVSKSSAVSSHGILYSACSASSPVGMAGAAWNHTTVRAE
jgi:tetratricopeptide (TPR) repeat protein